MYRNARTGNGVEGDSMNNGPSNVTHKPSRHSLGNELKRLRERKGLTAFAVAQRARVSPAYMTKLERGDSSPTLDVLKRLARALEVDPAELMDVDEVNDELGTWLSHLGWMVQAVHDLLRLPTATKKDLLTLFKSACPALPGERIDGSFDERIVRCYERHGGWSIVGVPYDNGGGACVHEWYRTQTQDFRSSEGRRGAIIALQDADEAYFLSGAPWLIYSDEYEGPGGRLGAPLSDPLIETDINGVERVTIEFELGTMLWLDDGTPQGQHEVTLRKRARRRTKPMPISRRVQRILPPRVARPER